MAAQTDDRFRWLILTTPETDAAIVKRLARAPNAVFERRQSGDFITVHAHQHNQLFRSMDAIQIWTKHPMWCTVVHGGNALNRMTGKSIDAPPENW